MHRRSLVAVLLTLATVACTPPPPPPPAPLPPPPPALSPEELAALNTVRARELWDQGTAFGRQGRWAQAERSYREAATLRPDSATYHMALATALLQMGRDSEAADALLAGIRAEEAEPEPNHRLIAVDYERLIQTLERVNRLDEARAAREKQRLHRMLRDTAPPR
ncbi:MAG TPA: tetratricopeptide repeat protein [Longimicrobium sp.]|nr:tetratricopeptide repeat protein [Longimicrobium sp.]